jgi:hypothetical protein
MSGVAAGAAPMPSATRTIVTTTTRADLTVHLSPQRIPEQDLDS